MTEETTTTTAAIEEVQTSPCFVRHVDAGGVATGSGCRGSLRPEEEEYHQSLPPNSEEVKSQRGAVVEDRCDSTIVEWPNEGQLQRGPAAGLVETIVSITNEAQARELAPIAKEEPETARRVSREAARLVNPSCPLQTLDRESQQEPGDLQLEASRRHRVNLLRKQPCYAAEHRLYVLAYRFAQKLLPHWHRTL